MADYSIAISVKPTGLNETIKSLGTFEKIAEKSVQTAEALAVSLTKLSKIDLSQYKTLFASAIANAQSLTKETGNVIHNLHSMTEELNRSTEATGRLNDTTENVSANIHNANTSAMEFGTTMMGIAASFEIASRTFDFSKNLIQGTVQARSEIQQLERQLGAVLGSEEKVQEWLPKLRQMANTTPNVDTEGAVKGVSTFMRMGYAVEEAENKMKTLANTTAYYGGTVESVKLALVQFEQMANKNGGWGEDIRSLTNHIPGIRQLIMDKWGTTDQDELKKLGVDTGKKLVEGIFEAMDELPEVDGGIAEQFSQLEDSIKTIKADLGEAFLPTFNKAVDLAAGFAKAIKNTPDFAKKFAAGAVVLAGLGSAFMLATVGGTKLFGLIRQGALELNSYRNCVIKAISAENIHNKTVNFNNKATDVLVASNKKLAYTVEARTLQVQRLTEAETLNRAEEERSIATKNKLETQIKMQNEALLQETAETQGYTVALENLRNLENSLSAEEEKLNRIRQEGIAITERRQAAENSLAEAQLKQKSIQNARKNIGNIGMGALMIGGTMAGSALSSYGSEHADTLGGAMSTFGGNVLMGASMGAMFGPMGAAIGGAVGALKGFTDALNSAEEAAKRHTVENYNNIYDPEIEKLEKEGKSGEARRLRAEKEYKQTYETGDKNGWITNTWNAWKDWSASKIWKTSKDEQQQIRYNNSDLINDAKKKYKNELKLSQEVTKEEEKKISLQEKIKQLHIEANSLTAEGKEFEALRKEAEAQYISIKENEKSTQQDITLAQQEYNTALTEIAKKEKDITAEKERQARLSRVEADASRDRVNGQGDLADLKLAWSKNNEVQLDRNASDNDKIIAENEYKIAENQYNLKQSSKIRDMETAQATFEGNGAKAKEITALKEYEQVSNDITKSLQEKWTAYYKYMTTLANNQADIIKKSIQKQKESINELIQKRKQNTDNVIAELEKERNARNSFKEMGQEAVLTTTYIDNSLAPAEYSDEEIRKAQETVSLREQVKENNRKQVSIGLYGNDEKDMTDRLKSIENMEKYISENNVTGQAMLGLVQNVSNNLSALYNILNNANRKVMNW